MRKWLSTLVLVLSGAVSGVAQGALPSFDCSKATASTEKMVCSDAGLAAMDRQVSDLYNAALKMPEAAAKVREQQRAWLKERNSCSGAEARTCVEGTYQRRLIALEIQTGKLSNPKLAEWSCGSAAPRLVTAFYNSSTPQSVLLTNGGEQAVALIAMSGSGSRYTAPGIEYWEHQGEAAVTWHGKKMTCKRPQ